MSKAFSLLELVLVVVILGLILSISSINFKKDRLLEGARQIINDIKYTRNLALMQDSFRVGELSVAKRQWYKSRWQLYFIKSNATDYEQTYTIFLDKNGDGNANLGKTDINLDREIAVDIINPKKLMNSGQSGVINKDDEKTTQRFNISKKFGIKKVEFKGSCSGGTKLVFDGFGRVYSSLKNSTNLYDKNLAKKGSECVLRLSSLTNSLCIIVDMLTGYAYIPEFENFNTQIISIKNKKYECSKL